MNHQSLKKKENNEKDSLFKGKFTKSSITFRKNKPNSPNVPIHLRFFITTTYAILTSLTKVKFKANQTQFKANSNPIAKRPKMNINSYNATNYKIFSRLLKNKTNPNFILDVSPPCFSVGGKANNQSTVPFFRVPHTLRGSLIDNHFKGKPNLSGIKMNIFTRKRYFTIMVVNSTSGIYRPVRVPISLEFGQKKVYGFFVDNNSGFKRL